MNSGATSVVSGTPAAEFELDTAFVAALLKEQHPDLADLPLRPVDEGWDNAMFRLGARLAVRLPRRAVAAALIRNEQVWLPTLAAGLSLPIPVPVRVGVPARGYPWHWSVVPWLAGEAADQNEPAASQAIVWGSFLHSLHKPSPAEAPVNPFRGVSLQPRARVMEERMQRLDSKTSLITTEVRETWQSGLSAPLDVPASWLHGDLHPRNVLVDGGAISGVVDWGDITSGDCATDLASLWMLFLTSQARQQSIAAYGGVSDATLRRAKAWAVAFGVMFLETGLSDNPRNAVLGEKILRQIAET